jgi:metallo-beta-lactamase class B
VEPLRIAGPLYYVGANSVTAFLITTPAGHILIDGGFDETVPLIRSGVEALGFQWKDVRLLLNSHAHFDHAGGLARIQQETGARFAASEQDAPLLERGGLGDDLLGDEAPFAPVRVDQRLKDGESVSLGGVTLTARVTAGHTRGCTSWDFEVEDAGERRRVVSICSLSVLDGMRFLEDPTYPGIADDFRRSFEVLEAIPADVFLASHAGFFDLEGKRERLGQPGPNPFVDPQGYRAYVETARERFDAALEAERAAQE